MRQVRQDLPICLPTVLTVLGKEGDMKDLFPWLIALLACMTLMVSNGLSITGLPVYDEALLSEFGWSRVSSSFAT